MLGSILFGAATPTEAAGIGAMGALVMAFLRKTLDREALSSSLSSTVETTAMVFFILIGASLFSLVFRGYGGDELVAGIFEHMPGGVAGALAIVMLTIFLLGLFSTSSRSLSWWCLSLVPF